MPSFRATTAIWASSIVVVASLVITLTRLPVSQHDEPFYASIVRAYHYGPAGVPSMLDAAAPTAVDHLPFYGPVYFRTLKVFFSVFGVSIGALRAVNLLGVLLFAAAGVYVCKALGGGPDRRAWTWVLLLLTPEAGTAASSGRMDSLAVGLQMCGLAILLDGLVRQRRPMLHGLGAGTLLAAAALTTPRTFPFMFGLLVAAIVEYRRAAPVPRQVIAVGLATAATALTIFTVWTFASSGGPLAWFRLMVLVATHENTDVALLPKATARDLMFTWWQGIVPVFSIVGSLVAAYLSRGRDATARALAGSFALVATWTTLVLTMTLFNYTFIFGMYFVLPLTTVAIALPTPLSDLRRRGAAFVALTLLLLLAGVRAAKIARVAISWDARDPARIEQFMADHIPPGSRVLGPGPDLFFPVESAGSHYFTLPQVSFADWARWIRPNGGQAGPVPPADYLVWRVHDAQPPKSVACQRRRLVAIYEPPPLNIPSLAWLVAADPFAGYPDVAIYELGPSRTCGV